MSPTLRSARRGGVTLLVLAAVASLVACVLPLRITGKVHQVAISVEQTDKECRIVVKPETACRAVDAPEDAVCVRADLGEGVRWYTPEREKFKIYLDPFGKAWSSTTWYARERREVVRAPKRRPELSGWVRYKYTVTVQACDRMLRRDPHIVVMY